MFPISQIEAHLIGMGHGSTLNKVRNIQQMFERSAARFIMSVKIIETMRLQPLSSGIFDNIYDYPTPSDLGEIIDLIPQDERTSWDNAFRNMAGQFDLEKAFKSRRLSIEGREGVKIIRINWRTNSPVTLNTMDSYNGNGTWSAVESATGVATDTIFRVKGGGSVVFNHITSGDGIQNTNMSQVDLTDENGVGNEFMSVYLSALPTSITTVWGNDLTGKYWTSAPITTQADGTAFQIGWNIITTAWASAVQSGTVDPTQIDSAKITFASSGALGKIRIDNVVFGIGRNFDLKYYSKYLYKSAATGAWISMPGSAGGNYQDDYVVVDNDTLPHFLMECLIDMAQQMEGTDSAFDIQFASAQLQKLYPIYKGMYPSQVKKTTGKYGGTPIRTAYPAWRRWP